MLAIWFGLCWCSGVTNATPLELRYFGAQTPVKSPPFFCPETRWRPVHRAIQRPPGALSTQASCCFGENAHAAPGKPPPPPKGGALDSAGPAAERRSGWLRVGFSKWHLLAVRLKCLNTHRTHINAPVSSVGDVHTLHAFYMRVSDVFMGHLACVARYKVVRHGGAYGSMFGTHDSTGLWPVPMRKYTHVSMNVYIYMYTHTIISSISISISISMHTMCAQETYEYTCTQCTQTHICIYILCRGHCSWHHDHHHQRTYA